MAAEVAKELTLKECSHLDVPNENNPKGDFTVQHIARMWFDRLMFSSMFMSVKEGVADPYTWTLGIGCQYDLKGERFSYTGKTEKEILKASSEYVYNIDEGVLIGIPDRNILIGGATPKVGEYNSRKNPLTEVKGYQQLYTTLLPRAIVKRVQHCKRPGGPIQVTEEQAAIAHYHFKKEMEYVWSRDWKDESTEVQFVGFTDDTGSLGTTGRMLADITLDNSVLTFVSILLIAFFSAVFLVSFDPVESRVLVTLVGVFLVVLSFFSAIAFGLLLGIKVRHCRKSCCCHTHLEISHMRLPTQINVTIAWTLPFVIIGLGVDDVYIVLLSLKHQRGYTDLHYHRAMREVVIPVTMTSLVNAAMFTIMNVSDIPAVYLTSRMALFAVVFLYLTVVFCFPAFCYLDMKRQAARRYDILFFIKSDRPGQPPEEDFRDKIMYTWFYKPLMFGKFRVITHIAVILISIVLVGVASWGVTKRQIGLGLEDFFPKQKPGSKWARFRADEAASWPVEMYWGKTDWGQPDNQMELIKTFEDVIATPHMAHVDTEQLWMAKFLIWTSKHCKSNFDRLQFEDWSCGADQYFEPEKSYCTGEWAVNKFNLKEKAIVDLYDDTCITDHGGICRRGAEMFTEDIKHLNLDFEASKNVSFCPVVKGWSDKKWAFCLRQWRNKTDSDDGGLRVVHGTATPKGCGEYHKDEEVIYPIPFSKGPLMFAYDLNTHDLTLEMIKQARAKCDSVNSIHCWMGGIPFDYWSQYEGIFELLITLSGYATLAGFTIAVIFLVGTFVYEQQHPPGAIIAGSIGGAALIAVSMVLTLICVVGFSCLASVNLTGFSNMSYVLSVGFAVEYSVHIVSRFMRADMTHVTALERAEFTMSFLVLPTFMSFVSSSIGVVCLAFTEFEFNLLFFFRPLIIVMMITYWFGCWFLPTLLCYMDFDILKLGYYEDEEDNADQKKIDESSEEDAKNKRGDEYAA